MPSRRLIAAIPLVLASTIAFSFQGSRGLYETTEGRYAESAREMIETGNWFLPQLDYRVHLTKPPLAYWAIASFMAVAGENEWGARLPNAVAFVLAVIAVQCLGSILWDERTAVAAGVIYATSPFAAAAANGVHTDSILSLFELLAILCYFRSALSVEKRSAKSWMLCSWISLGAAFLTKGTPALMVALSLGAYHLYLGKTGRQRPAIFAREGISLAALVGFSWYIAVALVKPGTMSYFMREEVYGRIFTPVHGRNAPFYMAPLVLLPPLVLGLGPALAVWPLAIARQRELFSRSNIKRAWRNDPRLAFLALWLLLPMSIFFLAKSRLPLYVLPIFPPVAIASARLALQTIESRSAKRKAIIAVLCWSGLLIALKWASAELYASDSDMKRLYRNCLSASGNEKARFYLYDSSGLFGLQFYLSGKLTRVSDEPQATWARNTVQSLCKEMKEASRFDRYVIVAETGRKESKLRERFLSEGIVATVIRSGSKYAIFVYPPDGNAESSGRLE